MNALGMEGMRLLLVEDNDQLAHWLARILLDDGFMLDRVSDGEAAESALRAVPYDVVLLDLNLPHLSGKSVLRRMREREDATPVLILTATGAVDEKVVLLGAGADDYIVKPFDARELVARVKVLARRQAPSRSNKLKCGNLTYDMDRCQFAVEGEPLALTPREHAVLEALILRAKKTVAKTMLADSLSKGDAMTSEDAIEIYVSRLRKKLEKSTATIITLRGLGYLLEDGADDE
ncbi:Transcriptional regulatory protein tctD [Burkholderia sp. AD24]|uniref:Winged helix family two component transcriptional regulator n=2 Tax=Paraburkholderia bryophila TaxID=420952 RepID=A0A329CIG2_9BURK|nr:Transcriptional regulatory protein tctD [Burkholderia sp. AD24]RAS34459.1 winged helix family two component transcriptional regulator [Paraburkholderia bryophila]